MAAQRTMTFGVVVGNRGFFPDHLAKTGREEIIAVLEAAGARAVVLSPEESKHGAVETYAESERCAELFKKHADEIDGIIVTLAQLRRRARHRGRHPALRAEGSGAGAGHARPLRRHDHRHPPRQLLRQDERLQQHDAVRHSLLADHAAHREPSPRPSSRPTWNGSPRFAASSRASRICASAPSARVPRPSTPCATPSASSRPTGISIETIDLSEIFGRINRMKDTDDAAQAKLAAIKSYVTTSGIPDEALLKMAKLGAVIDGWMKQTHVTVSAVQCWTSMEEFFGVVPCTIMSMMSNNLIPSACEVDVPGTLSMYMLALASQTPSALLDWNNNYGGDPDKCVCFHCSNLPKHFFAQAPTMDYQAIIAGTVGKENTFGTCVGRVKAGAMSYARYSTDDRRGVIRGYTGAGKFTDDPLETFGGAGVAEIPQLQKLLKYICREGFEHHVAANFSDVSKAVHEAATRYLGWESFFHGQPED